MSKIVPRSMLAANRSRVAVTTTKVGDVAALAQLPVEKAAEILAQCVKVDEAMKWRTAAEMLLVYQREIDGSAAAIHHAEALREHADRRVGELRAGERVAKGRPKKGTKVSDFSQAEKKATKRSVAASKAKAAVPAKRFSTTIGEALEAKRSPKKAVAKLIAKPKKPKPIEVSPVRVVDGLAEDAIHGFPVVHAPVGAGYAQTIPSDGWNERAAVKEMLHEMRLCASSWNDEIGAAEVRKTLARWQGMVRG